jgi:hypothetical protein
MLVAPMRRMSSPRTTYKAAGTSSGVCSRLPRLVTWTFIRSSMSRAGSWGGGGGSWAAKERGIATKANTAPANPPILGERAAGAPVEPERNGFLLEWRIRQILMEIPPRL